MSRSPRLALPARQDGFTLPEMIIAATIIAFVLAAFSVFMVNVAATQQTASLDRTASKVLSAELEKAAAMDWDDLMVAPGGAYTDCLLPDGRRSAQLVQPGPNLVTDEGMQLSVSRLVTWRTSGSTVSCSGAKDGADLKVFTATVQWRDRTKMRTKTAFIWRSKYASAVLATNGQYVGSNSKISTLRVTYGTTRFVIGQNQQVIKPTVKGGVGTRTWRIVSGTLPPNVSFSTSTGYLTGPTTAQWSGQTGFPTTLTIQVTDKTGASNATTVTFTAS